MDDEETLLKDDSPYLLFKCHKCMQYLYVKIKQKTKKCLRCGLTHKVANVMNRGEIINGLFNVIEKMKTRQHEIAKNELGIKPEFNSFHEFKIKKSQEVSNYSYTKENIDQLFIATIKDIQRQYHHFPIYIIELKAEEYGIPVEEIQILINKYRLKGILIKTKEGLFTFKN